MKKKGFTFLELMIAVSIFLIMAVFIIKLDSTTSTEIKNLGEMAEKSEIAQSELEKFKSNPINNTSKTISGYSGYVVTLTSSNTGNAYAAVTEVTIAVKKDVAPADPDPYVLTAHVLLK